jgi:hypothetical protein
MNVGKTLFAQVMDLLPWKNFRRIVTRYGGDHRARTLSCAGQFRVMAFTQLTYRESLRDIEACLADANELRDWRIYADFAQVLIAPEALCRRKPWCGAFEYSLCAGRDYH